MLSQEIRLLVQTSVNRVLILSHLLAEKNMKIILHQLSSVVVNNSCQQLSAANGSFLTESSKTYSKRYSYRHSASLPLSPSCTPTTLPRHTQRALSTTEPQCSSLHSSDPPNLAAVGPLQTCEEVSAFIIFRTHTHPFQSHPPLSTHRKPQNKMSHKVKQRKKEQIRCTDQGRLGAYHVQVFAFSADSHIISLHLRMAVLKGYLHCVTFELRKQTTAPADMRASSPAGTQTHETQRASCENILFKNMMRAGYLSTHTHKHTQETEQ